MKTGLRRAACVALCALSADARAHGSVQGLGNFFGGAVHPLLEPAHLIALIAFGLLIGPRFAESHPAAVVFTLATIAGGVAAAFGVSVDTDTVLLAAAAVTGLAAVLAAPLPKVLYVASALVLGLGIGLGSRPDGPLNSAALTALAGSCLGAGAWMVNVVAFAQAMRKPWMRVLVRVFASWVSAASLLVLALILSGHPLNPSVPADANAGAETAPSLDLRRN